MLIPNLAVLLAERRLTISKVSEDTRISRTTLTSLSSGAAKGVQFDTLNTLCQYLRVTPGDLFAYRPFDISVALDLLPDPPAVRFTVSRAGRPPERYVLDCRARFAPAYSDAPLPDTLRIRLSVPADPVQADRARELEHLLRSLPAPALAEIELQILRALDARLDKTALPADDYTPDLTWPWQ